MFLIKYILFSTIRYGVLNNKKINNNITRQKQFDNHHYIDKNIFQFV